MNKQCDHCGQLLLDQEDDGTASPNENVFCSMECLRAFEQESLLSTEPDCVPFDEIGDPGPYLPQLA